MQIDEPFVLTVIDKFSAGGIGELSLDDGCTRLVLRKDAAISGSAPPAAPGSPAPSGADGETVTSPIVGTFYAAPGSGAPPFVRPGSKVKAGDTLCILEAMKMMNHLEAEFECEILAVRAVSGDMVEFGQILFEVKRL